MLRSSCRQMASHEPVFVPNENHHKDVEDGKDDQPGSMRVGETIKLVEDEQPEYDQRGGIGPEFASEQPDDQEDFYRAMAQQIEGIESLRADREILRPHEQVRCNEIVRVLDKFVLSEPVGEVRDRVCTDDGQCNTAEAFDERVSSLEQNTHLEELVDPLLFHAPTGTEGRRSRLRTESNPALCCGKVLLSLFCAKRANPHLFRLRASAIAS